ncbi:MAG: hydrogenase iron-sulfur subunit [Candidatus Heimdallarchaeota archaeon]|nr:hydrogenase iron-sulfur subunit [Candidatus Heimdallarchaeota archaeon]MCK4954215.1 hydrogenase iron-sulfur subunit [Candidatus Heimdallarchaeota archaeon]
MSEFEPNIIGFLCNWCSYAGADLAGTSRIKYPSNIKIVRVMCSGRVDPVFVLEALKKGADGVLISGCHFGECHYKSGNYKASRRMKLLKKYFEEIGIEPQRVKFVFVSASEGQKFASEVEEFVKELKELGPFTLTVEAV